MKYVALLRGIMPQINPRQKMENLRKIFEELGLSNVKSFIASGNIIFESPISDKEKLATVIEKALQDKTGVNTIVILRTKEEINKLITQNPFEGTHLSPSQRPHITFFKQKTQKAPPKISGSQVIKVFDDAICYTVDFGAKTPNIMGNLEKEYGKEITTRTLNMIQRIGKLL